MPELLKTKLINDANLKAYYRLENGALLTDSSGNGFTLTNLNTVAEATGKYGGGADFGSANTNKALQVNSKLGFTNPTDQCSISIWVKLNTEISSGAYSFVCKSIYGANFTQVRIEYEYNGGTRRVRMGVNGANAFATVNYNLTMGTSNWHHFVVVYNGGLTGAIRGYVNGVYAGTTNANLGSTYAGTDNLSMSAIDSPGNAPGSFMIDEVAVFNRVLVNWDIEELYYDRSYGEFQPNSNTKILMRMNHGNDLAQNQIANYDGAVYQAASAKFGVKGAYFNGSSYRLQMPSTDLSGNFTISLWFRGAETATWRWLMDSQIANGNGILITTNAGNVRVSMGGWFTDIIGSQPYTLSSSTAWYNLIITRSGTTVTCYVNGEQYGSTGTSSANCTGPINIGVVWNSIWNYFAGDIDEVIIEAPAWSASQVRNYYNNCKGNFAPHICD